MSAADETNSTDAGRVPKPMDDDVSRPDDVSPTRPTVGGVSKQQEERSEKREDSGNSASNQTGNEQDAVQTQVDGATSPVSTPPAAAPALPELNIPEHVALMTKAFSVITDVGINTKEKVAQKTVHILTKMMQQLQKNPKSVRVRRLQCANVLSRRYILEVKGGTDFLVAFGFKLHAPEAAGRSESKGNAVSGAPPDDARAKSPRKGGRLKLRRTMSQEEREKRARQLAEQREHERRKKSYYEVELNVASDKNRVVQALHALDGWSALEVALGRRLTEQEKQQKAASMEVDSDSVASSDAQEKKSGNVEADDPQKEDGSAEKDSSDSPTGPVKKKCLGGCGFWGRRERGYLCSVCHKKNEEKAKPEGTSQSTSKPTSTRKRSTKCTKGCGFFGSSKFNGMCSKCFKDSGGSVESKTKSKSTYSSPSYIRRMRRGKHLPKGGWTGGSTVKKNTSNEKLEKKVDSSGDDSSKKDEGRKPSGWFGKWYLARLKLMCFLRFQRGMKRPKQKNRKRCFKCKKKVGYLGFECRCKYVFCATHRHAMDHNCDFDYESLQQQKLSKNNKGIERRKIEGLGDDE